jgi:hypothetical protein
MSAWMPNCLEISRIVSDSFDRKLSFGRRMAMWMHLLMCIRCFRFRKELLAIRRAVRNGHGAEAGGKEPCLPEATRGRIKQALRRAEEHLR